MTFSVKEHTKHVCVKAVGEDRIAEFGVNADPKPDDLISKVGHAPVIAGVLFADVVTMIKSAARPLVVEFLRKVVQSSEEKEQKAAAVNNIIDLLGDSDED